MSLALARLRLPTIGLFALAAACQPKQAPPQPVAQAGAAERPALGGPVSAAHIRLETGLTAPPRAAPDAERQVILAVLREAQAAATTCYAQAVQRNPYLYGDIEVYIELTAGGGVRETHVRYGTLGDLEMEDCVLVLVRGLSFPAPSRDGLKISYPFIFTSDLTPPEVERALLVRHGLAIPALDEPLEDDPNLDPARGQQGWWETW